MSELALREAIPVKINFITLYCENFKSSTMIELSEQSTVAGEVQITNMCRKSTKLVFKGRVHDENRPLSPLFLINTMGSKSGYTVEYRGIEFVNCRTYSITVEDKGDDFIYVSITVVTPSSINSKS